MRLVIYEHILFGGLRPWLTDDATILAAEKNISELSASYNSLLENFPGIIEELESEWDKYVSDPPDVERFINFDPEESFDRKTSWYIKLIQLESLWFLGKADIKIKKLARKEDQVFEVNTILRYLVDLLKHAEKLNAKDKDRQVDYILSQVQYHIMQFILDICLRFEHLDGIDRYNEENMFTEVLNHQPPDSPLFYRTPACMKNKLRVLLKENRTYSGIGKLRSEVIKEIEKADRNDQGSPEQDREYIAIVEHLENALFLLMMNASFISDKPGKLLSADFCKEWVQGIRRDFLSEEDAKRASVLFSDLLDISEQFEQVLNISTGSQEYQFISEAQRFLSTVKEISERPSKTVGTAGYDRKKKDEEDIPLDFAESFQRRFMTIKEFDSVFPGTREATLRYIKNGDIRRLEITREVKFLYRADVERFIDEHTLDGE